MIRTIIDARRGRGLRIARTGAADHSTGSDHSLPGEHPHHARAREEAADV